MAFKARKFYVWLISLAVVLTMYLLVSRLSETPQIERGPAAESAGTVADFNSEIGMIGDVGVGVVRKARYIHLNENKEIDREFGFEKLLHEEGDNWEIEKPYMNIFRRNLKCYITADKGQVQVETAAGRTSPKDATLTGNVVIHILPENSGVIKESFIYLDDVIFISEKSQFSTAGPVKFVSQDAQMLGTGLELVYNDEADRLEFLRIIHLETLRLKGSSKTSLFPSQQTEVDSSAGVSSQVQTKLPDKPVAVVDFQKAKRTLAPSQKTVEQRAGEYYRCVFSKNVVIDTPEQLIFADQVSINNIFSPRSSSSKSNEADTVGEDNAETTNVPVARPSEPNESPEEFVDIAVTCDGGIVITPMDSARAPEYSANSEPEVTETDDKSPGNFDDVNGRTTLVAQKIDYCASTGETVATGPTELTFYVSDIMAAESGKNKTSIPVKVTAQKAAKFSAALNQVIFEGDCQCTMLREDPNSRQKYTLSAPKLTVDLSGDETSATGIDHLTAGGGVVRLATFKTADEKLLGGIELKCRKFDFDADRQLFLATGPGLIALDNSRVSEPNEPVGRFSLQRPCWAIIQNFDTLKYFLQSNQIIADAEHQGILIDYFPIVQGQYARQISATAGHIQAFLYEAAGGQSELSTLSATGGITYEDEDKQFAGSRLFYDANESIITVHGDGAQPCLLNGAAVDAIELDLKTGKVKAKILGPGVL